MHHGTLQEPSPEMKELAMGYKRGSTAISGLMSSARHKLLGACLDQNVAAWLISMSLHYIPSEAANFNDDLPPNSYPDAWIVDGGATAHFTAHRSDFAEYCTITPRLVHGINLHAVGMGTIHLQVEAHHRHRPGTRPCTVTLHKALHVPDLSHNGAQVTRLFSQRAAHTVQKGNRPTFISSP